MKKFKKKNKHIVYSLTFYSPEKKKEVFLIVQLDDIPAQLFFTSEKKAHEKAVWAEKEPYAPSSVKVRGYSWEQFRALIKMAREIPLSILAVDDYSFNIEKDEHLFFYIREQANQNILYAMQPDHAPHLHDHRTNAVLCFTEEPLLYVDLITCGHSYNPNEVYAVPNNRVKYRKFLEGFEVLYIDRPPHSGPYRFLRISDIPDCYDTPTRLQMSLETKKKLTQS